MAKSITIRLDIEIHKKLDKLRQTKKGRVSYNNIVEYLIKEYNEHNKQ